MYGQVATEVSTRRFACDVYHFGSLIVFIFARAHMNALIVKYLDPSQRPKFWGGTYADVLPYVQAAFGEAVREFGEHVPEPFRNDVMTMVAQLCEPNPGNRGHPLCGRNHAGQYSLERYVSALNLLAYKAELHLKSGHP
jgi:hypothetical protein